MPLCSSDKNCSSTDNKIIKVQNNQHEAINGYNHQNPTNKHEPSRPPTNEAVLNHWKSTLALCFSLLCHSYLLISVFPYSGFMAIHLIDGLNSENAGSYAGLLASSFMIGRALSSYIWGKLADVIGRKPVMNGSLLFSCLFSILFGLSPTFGLALLSRFLLGLSNGLVGTVKTVVSELARGDEKVETQSMGLVMGMWGWGFLICPAISGWLAEPVKQYPHSELVEWFEPVLSRFPFLLPNVAAALFCSIAFWSVCLCVEETLPEEQRRDVTSVAFDVWTWMCKTLRGCRQNTESFSSVEALPLRSSIQNGTSNCNRYYTNNSSGNHGIAIDEEREIAKFRTSESCSMLSTQFTPHSKSCTTCQRQSLELKRGSSSSSSSSMSDKSGSPNDNDEQQPTASLSSIWSRKSTRQHLISYWMFSFVGTCVDESFPLFCLSKQAGLGLSEFAIGKILSGSGLIFGVSQYFVYTFLVDRYGLYNSLKIGSSLSIPLTILVPVSAVLNSNHDNDGQMSWSAYLFLCVLMAFYRIFASVYFSSLTIATNRTVPVSYRASMNGLSMLGGSFAKALGPTFAGSLVASCLSSGIWSPQVGSFVIFAVIGMLGCLVLVGTFVFLDHGEKKSVDREKSVAV